MDPKGLFFVDAPVRPHLDAFLWEPADDELHFYARGVSAREFAAVFEAPLASLQTLVTAFDPAILVADFWEPHTRDAEEALREKLGGAITRRRDGKAELWRADRADGRLLAEPGVATLVHGHVLRGPGALAAALSKRPSEAPLEYAAFASLPTDPAELGRFASRTAGEMETFRPAAAKPEILFSHDGAGAMRAVFRTRPLLRRAVNALLSGYARRLTGRHVAAVSDRTADQFQRVTDGLGLASSSSSDFVNKKRTLEFRAWLGRSLWPVRATDVFEDLGEDPYVLVYYDGVGGMWEVVS